MKVGELDSLPKKIYQQPINIWLHINICKDTQQH